METPEVQKDEAAAGSFDAISHCGGGREILRNGRSSSEPKETIEIYAFMEAAISAKAEAEPGKDQRGMKRASQISPDSAGQEASEGKRRETMILRQNLAEK